MHLAVSHHSSLLECFLSQDSLEWHSDSSCMGTLSQILQLICITFERYYKKKKGNKHPSVPYSAQHGLSHNRHSANGHSSSIS